MATNVWGCDYRMCVSDRAFDDYQTKEEQRKLLQAYKQAGIKRFHYTNSGTIVYTQCKWFVSYYTFILGYSFNDATKEVYMHVNPFAFLKDEYKTSQTTNRQANKWLKENGFKFTVQELENVYKNAIHGIASYPLTRYVEGSAEVLVLPRFNHCQTYINEYGLQIHELAIDKVPWLAYKHQNTLVRDGWSINDGNTFGVKYE